MAKIQQTSNIQSVSKFTFDETPYTALMVVGLLRDPSKGKNNKRNKDGETLKGKRKGKGKDEGTTERITTLVKKRDKKREKDAKTEKRRDCYLQENGFSSGTSLPDYFYVVFLGEA